MNPLPEKYQTRSTPTTPSEALAWIEELHNKLLTAKSQRVIIYLCAEWSFRKKQTVYAAHAKSEVFQSCEKLCKEMNRSVDIMDRFR